jgi:hypothetical protein
LFITSISLPSFLHSNSNGNGHNDGNGNGNGNNNSNSNSSSNGDSNGDSDSDGNVNVNGHGNGYGDGNGDGDGNGAAILGDPYAKKSPLPHIGVTSHLPVSPSIPYHRILGQSCLLNRLALPHTLSRTVTLG